ncbi:MAG: hypothetical protein ACI4P3_03790 [Candidatus Spyradosoma sp.]
MIIKLQNFFARVPLWIYALAIFAVALGVRLHWIQMKENFHCDESMSVHLCSYTEWKFESGKIYSGRELKNIVYANDAGMKDFAKDIFHLRENNRDYCHTNVYYSLLRCALFGADTTDMHAVVTRGFVLNIALFSVAFVFLTLLLRELFAGKLAVVSGLVAGTLCTGTISMSMWIRPYDLQLAAMSVFAFVFVRCVKTYLRGDSLVSWKNFWALAVISAGTLLSVYFSVLAVVLFGATLCVLALWRIGKSELPFLISVFALGVTFATAIYPNYPLGFLVGRGTEAASKFSPIRIFSNIWDSVIGGILVLADDAMFVPALALLVVAAFAIWRNRNSAVDAGEEKAESVPAVVFLSLVVPAFLAYWATLYLAPYKIVRYVAALLPILLVSVPWALSATRSRVIYVLGNLAFIGVFCGGVFFAKPLPMRASGDVGKVALRAPRLGVGHLAYWNKPDCGEALVEVAKKNPRFVVLDDWRTHGLDLMKLPDSAQVVFAERQDADRTSFDLSNIAPQWNDFALVVPIWGRVSLLGIREIILPKGKVYAETHLDTAGLLIPFSREGSAQSLILKLNEESAQSGGNYFDVVPAEN